MNSLTGNSSERLDAPAPNELEMVIFGPGVGECVLLHLGNEEWFVVDCCRFPGHAQPAPLEYLETIGVEPSTAVKRILATHWHDDHIAGIAEVFRRCDNAKFVMSSALNVDQFLQLVFEVKENNPQVSASSSATEFAEVLDHLQALGQRYITPHIFASDGSTLFTGGFNNSARVQAVSPSAASLASSKVDLANRLLTMGKTRRFKKHSPNDLSVAVHVSVGNVQLLLGADLENTHDPAFGWKAVLASPVCPTQKGCVFKIPHHGSSNANHNGVWLQLLNRNPVSIVTPFSRQAVPLPQDTDIDRMRQKTSKLYLTTWPPTNPPVRRDGVDGILRGATKVRRSLNRRPGFVRVRIDLCDVKPRPRVTLFGSAKKL